MFRQRRRIIRCGGRCAKTFDCGVRPGVFILRHTLMNPFLMDSLGERSYSDMYRDFPEEAIDAALVE